jgi:hypothetical protein
MSGARFPATGREPALPEFELSARAGKATDGREFFTM